MARLQQGISLGLDDGGEEAERVIADELMEDSEVRLNMVLAEIHREVWLVDDAVDSARDGLFICAIYDCLRRS